jgi:hypothetical protein
MFKLSSMKHFFYFKVLDIEEEEEKKKKESKSQKI